MVGFCGEGGGCFWGWGGGGWGGGGGALVGAWTGFELCGGAMVNRSYTSPPPLPQRSPRVRRRHNLHNYTALSQ